MAELTTDDGSTASPEAIRRFEERNQAMTDQTTDHLSGAVEAVHHKLWRLGNEKLTLAQTRVALEAPEVATYYEDKGRARVEELEEQLSAKEADLDEAAARLTELERERDNAAAGYITAMKDLTDRWEAVAERESKRANDELTAAEDKGRSEERERVVAAIRKTLHDRQSYNLNDLVDAALASLDSDQEGS